MSTKEAFDGALRQAIGSGQRGQLPQQAQIWAAVRDDPAKTTDYVRRRTGLTGDSLATEVFNYTREMKIRYG